MKILRIAMDGEEHPNYVMENAFKNAFDFVKTIWWQHQPDLNTAVCNEVMTGNYDAVFMQIQTEGIITEQTAKIISENSIGFNWTGDVRNNIDWYIKLGKYLVTLFTNQTDVDRMRSLGLRSDYLQIGYDHKYYYPIKSECHNNIVFCANFYPDNDYPLTNLRRELVHELKKEFGDKFNLYGGNWKKIGFTPEYDSVNNEEEAEIYRTCAIAINCSHFNYSRYSSDRLFREMACGAFVLSHRFTDYEIDFKEREHLVTWLDIPDLIKKCHFYLENAHERERISRNAIIKVENTATWSHRVEEFKKIINKYKN